MIFSQNLEINKRYSKNIFIKKNSKNCFNEKKVCTDKKLLAKFVLMNSIKEHSLYGVSVFWVETFYKNLKDLGKLWPKFLWIGIKYESILFIYPKKQLILKTIKYEELIEIIKHPKSIIFILNNQSFRFNTNKSYEIHQLVKEYQKLEEILRNNIN